MVSETLQSAGKKGVKGMYIQWVYFLCKKIEFVLKFAWEMVRKNLDMAAYNLQFDSCLDISLKPLKNVVVKIVQVFDAECWVDSKVVDCSSKWNTSD